MINTNHPVMKKLSRKAQNFVLIYWGFKMSKSQVHTPTFDAEIVADFALEDLFVDIKHWLDVYKMSEIELLLVQKIEDLKLDINNLKNNQ